MILLDSHQMSPASPAFPMKCQICPLFYAKPLSFSILHFTLFYLPLSLFFKVVENYQFSEANDARHPEIAVE